MTKFKLGDRVRCKIVTEENDKTGRGAGYKEGFEFTITEITPALGIHIYWKGHKSNGVFEHALELAEEKNWKRRLEQ